jgi:membrane fusion protein
MGFLLITGTALIFAIIVVIFAFVGGATRKVKVPGILSPVLGSLQLTAPQSAILVSVRATEGGAVKKGQILFVLSTDRTSGSGAAGILVANTLAQRKVALQAERRLRELQAKQRVTSQADKVRSLEIELVRADSELEYARRRVELSKKTAQRFEKLEHEGFVADAQAQTKQEEVLDFQARADAVQRNVLSMRRDIQTVRAESADITIQSSADLMVLDRQLASLAQEVAENDARKEVTIIAPADGTLTAITLHPGQMVQAGQVLSTFIPNNSVGKASALEAQLYAPSRTVGFIQPGQLVWLTYAAFPYQKFGMHGGRITEISRSPINPQDLPAGQQQALINAAQVNEPLYRLTVKLDAQFVGAYAHQQSLRPGMALEGYVIQERRAIWEWILEPLIAVHKRTSI